MTAIKNYKLDFIKRTKEILERKYQDFENEDREVTFLLNCLLGLIITISENEKKKQTVFIGNIDESFMKLIPNKIGFIDNHKFDKDFTNSDLTELNLKIGHKADLKGKDKLWFIKKLRNGIAHQNIQGVNENNIWTGVRLWNSNNSRKDFEIVFTIEELENLAIKLSDIYLSNIK